MIVADTNLLVYFTLPGDHTEAAEAVFARDPDWAAPTLWRSEFLNVLVLYRRKGFISRETAGAAFAIAEAAVAGREHAPSAERVLDLALASSCSAYDCEFVAVAETLGIPLVTSDARLLKDWPRVAVTPAEFATRSSPAGPPGG